MTLSAAWALQQAVHAALSADGTLASFVDGRLFDRPPADVAFPFVTLGDMEVSEAGTGSNGGAVHFLTLVVWSRATGRREAKEIMSALHEVLHDAPLPLAGHALVSLRFEQAGLVYDANVEALRGTLRFRAYTETQT